MECGFFRFCDPQRHLELYNSPVWLLIEDLTLFVERLHIFPVNKSEVFAKLTANWIKCVTIVTLYQHLLLFKEQHITLFCRQKVNILHLFLISVENTRVLIQVIRYRLNHLLQLSHC